MAERPVTSHQCNQLSNLPAEQVSQQDRWDGGVGWWGWVEERWRWGVGGEDLVQEGGRFCGIAGCESVTLFQNPILWCWPMQTCASYLAGADLSRPPCHVSKAYSQIRRLLQCPTHTMQREPFWCCCIVGRAGRGEGENAIGLLLSLKKCKGYGNVIRECVKINVNRKTIN